MEMMVWGALCCGPGERLSASVAAKASWGLEADHTGGQRCVCCVPMPQEGGARGLSPGGANENASETPSAMIRLGNRNLLQKNRERWREREREKEKKEAFVKTNNPSRSALECSLHLITTPLCSHQGLHFTLAAHLLAPHLGAALHAADPFE